MKIHFHYRLHGPEGRYRLKSYGPTAPQTPCCQDMSDWFNHIVALGVRGLPLVRNIRCVLVYQRDFGSEIGEVKSVIPIDYCPWCGEKLTLVDEGVENAPETQATPPTVPTLDF